MIYLDNNATTRPLPEVAEAVAGALDTAWANPSSAHSMGRAAAAVVGDARAQVAGLVGARPDDVVFASGATEANEAVLRHCLREGRILVTSEAEHPAVTGHYHERAPDLVRPVPVDRHGRWRLDALDAHLSEGPALVALAWANGETGVLQDVERIGRQALDRGARVLLDASQVVGRAPVAAHALPATYLTFSGHKLHAPKGVGALVMLGDEESRPIMQVGGGQEGGARGGTENVPGIAGLGEACRLRRECLDPAISRLAGLRDRFEALVLEGVPGARVNGAGAPRVPNTSNVAFEGVDGMALVARLDARDVICSQVSACSSGLPEPSRALTAMGLSEEDAYASVRFAFALDNLDAHAEFAARALAEEIAFLKGATG